eukprot:3087928-Amphidinium_carterae.1
MLPVAINPACEHRSGMLRAEKRRICAGLNRRRSELVSGRRRNMSCKTGCPVTTRRHWKSGFSSHLLFDVLTCCAAP